MKNKRLVKSLVLGLLVAVSAAWPGTEAQAQTDAEYLTAINFRFSNPGARARAMGGNLVALASADATSAFVNPAGLAFCARQQVTLEYTREQDEFLAARVETGFTSGGDPAFAPRRPTITTESDFVSFASYFLPIDKWKKRIGVSFFYAQPLEASGGVDSFVDTAFFPEIDPDILFRPVRSSVTAENEVVGASIGVGLTGNFGLGLSLGVSELSFEGLAQRGSAFDPNAVANSQSSLVDAETDLFVTVGALWEVKHFLILGASWQKQTGYNMRNVAEVAGRSDQNRSFDSEFTIPTRFALGLLWKRNAFRVGLEADHIQYSDLVEEAQGKTFFGETSGDPTYAYSIQDVTELHLGAEWILPQRDEGPAWSLRAGVWRDEAHAPYYSGEEPLEKAWAPRLDQAIYHWTAGFGFEGERIIIDVAGDFSPDAGTDLLISAIFKLDIL